MNPLLSRAYRKLDAWHAWEIAGGVLCLVLLVAVGVVMA